MNSRFTEWQSAQRSGQLELTARGNPDHQVSNSEKAYAEIWVDKMLTICFIRVLHSVTAFLNQGCTLSPKNGAKDCATVWLFCLFHCCWDQNQCCTSSPVVWPDTMVGRLTGDGRLFEYTRTQLRGALLWGTVPGPQLLLRWFYSHSNKMWDHSLIGVVLPKALTNFWPLVLWGK